MKKFLVLGLVLLCLTISSTAFGASARWSALGNDHRFIIDTSNYGSYPSRVNMFGDALWLIPIPSFENNNIAAGVLLNVKPNMVGAFHINLASAGAKKLSSTLSGYEGTNDRLAGLQPRTFPDLFWGVKSGKNSYAARVALAMDSASNDPVSTSAMAADIALGATMGLPCGDVDLGLSAGIQSFSDDDGSKVTESTGGFGVSVDARLNKKMSEKYTLVPLANLKIGADPTESGVTEVSYLGGDAGVGLRGMYGKTMVLVGALVGFNSVTKTPEGKDSVTETTFAPKVLMGAEIPIKSWLVARGGANAEMVSKSNGGSSMDVRYYYNSGIRVIYGKFILDLILSRDLFYRGPYFISGAGEGANLATNICMIYKF